MVVLALDTYIFFLLYAEKLCCSSRNGTGFEALTNREKKNRLVELSLWVQVEPGATKRLNSASVRCLAWSKRDSMKCANRLFEAWRGNKDKRMVWKPKH